MVFFDFKIQIFKTNCLFMSFGYDSSNYGEAPKSGS